MLIKVSNEVLTDERFCFYINEDGCLPGAATRKASSLRQKYTKMKKKPHTRHQLEIEERTCSYVTWPNPIAARLLLLEDDFSHAVLTSLANAFKDSSIRYRSFTLSSSSRNLSKSVSWLIFCIICALNISLLKINKRPNSAGAW